MVLNTPLIHLFIIIHVFNLLTANVPHYINRNQSIDLHPLKLLCNFIEIALRHGCNSIDWFLYDGKHWSLMG